MPTILFNASDLRGSVRAVCDADGKPVAWFGYDPFGVALDAQSGGQQRLLERLTRRHTGQVFEAETMLYHYGARLYDDALARFASADPAHRTPSPYSHCGNDPIDHIDPDGRAPGRLIYFRGWFLIINEQNVVMAIFGDSDEAIERSRTAIEEFLIDDEYISAQKTVLMGLAENAGRTVQTQRRLAEVIEHALERGRRERKRLWIRAGYRASASRRSRRENPLFDTQTRLKAKTPLGGAREGTREGAREGTRGAFYHWSVIGRDDKAQHEEGVKSRTLSYIFRKPLHPDKLTICIESSFKPLPVLDAIQDPAYAPDPKLYLFLMRHRHQPFANRADEKRYQAIVAQVSAQLRDDESTESLSAQDDDHEAQKRPPPERDDQDPPPGGGPKFAWDNKTGTWTGEKPNYYGSEDD